MATQTETPDEFKSSFDPTRVVLIQESDKLWAAVYLDHFIVSSGLSAAEAREHLGTVVTAQERAGLQGDATPLAEFEPAPQWLWDKWREQDEQ